MKKIALIAIVLSLALPLAACGQLDVVGKESAASFGAVLAAMGDGVAIDEMNGGWSLEAPDGTARFIWSADYSKSPLHDLMLEFDAQPFIDAGLDTDSLPEAFSYYDGKLMVGTKLGDEALKYDGEASPLASYEQIVSKHRKSLGYHAALDHFNVSLGNGNLFEWAKDMAKNASDGSVQDKDIVFVLDPAPFIEAGADPAAVEGWAFAKVSVDIDGKPAEVDKFLKAFDLS